MLVCWWLPLLFVLWLVSLHFFLCCYFCCCYCLFILLSFYHWLNHVYVSSPLYKYIYILKAIDLLSTCVMGRCPEEWLELRHFGPGENCALFYLRGADGRGATALKLTRGAPSACWRGHEKCLDWPGLVEWSWRKLNRFKASFEVQTDWYCYTLTHTLSPQQN